MATYTANLGLALPSVSDAADINVLNENFKVIDAKIPAAGAAPAGIVTGDHWANSDDEFISIVSSAYNGMADHTTKFINVRVVGTQFSGYWAVEINRYNASMGSAVAWNFGDTIQAAMYQGAWQPFEWLNPPMTLGVEYRTTERWQGKAVYTKLIDFGALPNNTEKIVGHGIDGLALPLSVEVIATKSNWSFTLPSSHSNESTVLFNTNGVQITTTIDRSEYTAYATLRYTKA